MSAETKHHWTVAAAPPPPLSKNQWLLSSFVGAVLMVAALLQIIGFQEFSNNFSATGLGNANWWAGAIIFAEIWAATGFFKLRLSPLFRAVSNFMALLVAVFWVFETASQVSGYSGISYKIAGLDHQIVANFFGKYLTQPIGWWPVVEASIATFLILHSLEAFGAQSGARSQIVTKVTRRSGKKEIQNV